MVEGIGFGRRRLIEKIIQSNWGKLPESKKFTYNELLFIIQELFTEEGKAYANVQSIGRGFNLFRDFVKYLLYRNLANYDSMVLISSEKGAGKSSAALMIAREWCKLIGIQFNPKRHIAYSNSDMLRKIETLNNFEPLIADESVRFASSEDWNKKENKELKKKLAQVRTKHLLFILCFPLKIYKLEKNYLESFVNFWVDLYSRGQGCLYVKDKNPNKSSWGLEHFKKLGSYTEFSSSSQIEKVLKKHPNFWKMIKFPKPPRWLYEKYLSVREKNVYDDNNILASMSKEDIHRALLVLALRDIMNNDVNLTMNRIILHIKNEYDIHITKSMVQSIVDDAKQLVNKLREEMIK